MSKVNGCQQENNMVKILGCNTTTGFVTEAVDQLLSQPRQPYPHPTISPSQISECMRKLVALLVGLTVEETIEPRYQRIFDNGTYVHKRFLKEYLAQTQIVCKIFNFEWQTWKPFIEFTLQDPEYWLKGQPDALVFNPYDGLRYVFELKSVKHENFQNLAGPELSHVMQVHLYMYLCNIPRAVILYECKNDQEIKEYVIEQQPEQLSFLLQRIRNIQGAVATYKATGQLPLCEQRNAKFPCRCNQVKI
jgi:hypothetical protein